MLAVSLTVHHNTRSMVEDNRWVAHTHIAVARAQELLTLIVDMETGVRGFLISGNDVFLEPYDQSIALWREKIEIISSQVSDNPSQVERLQVIDNTLNHWLITSVDQALNQRHLVSTGRADMQSIVELVQQKTGKRIVDSIREQVAEFIAIEDKLIEIRTEKSAQSAQRTSLTLLFGTLFSVIVSVGVAVWSSNRVKRQITSLLTATKKVTLGDLAGGHSILKNIKHHEGKDELAKLSEGLKDMTLSLVANDVKMRDYNTQLQAEGKRAEQAAKAKSDFLSTMSHEIRTPINGVLGMTNLLLESPLDREQQKMALSARMSSESLLTIIDDILDFSKIEADKIEFEMIDFDLSELVESVGAMLHVSAEKKGIDLTCPASAIINRGYRGDPGRIRQILSNLVSNAVKFTESGEVAVRVSITANPNDIDLIRFEVKDKGAGISQEQQKKLFSRFSQVDSSTTRKYGGTGLGLSICKRLTEMMGGTIGVESVVDIGSTFWVEIPLHKSTQQINTPSLSNKSNTQRILIVDHLNSRAELLSQLLDHLGISYHLTNNGEAAFSQLISTNLTPHAFSTVILDYDTPDISAIEFVERLAQHSNIKQPHIIVSSTVTQRREAGLLQNDHINGYLTKPITQSDFIELIESISNSNNCTLAGALKQRHTPKEKTQYKARILVVDDVATNQAVLQLMLNKYGIKVDKARNGIEALASLENCHKNYDLVFMDCQMPEMDGYEATRVIRRGNNSKINAAIPIVAMTANAIQGDRDKCIDSGMDDYVTKPINAKALELTLDKWLVHLCQSASNSESYA